MSNKTQLQQNNNNLDTLITRVTAAKDVAASLARGEDLEIELDEYISLNTELEEVINSLPEAGNNGGTSSIKTFTGTITGPSALGEYPDFIYYYTDETSTFCKEQLTRGEEKIITILANTPIIFADDMNTISWDDISNNVLLASRSLTPYLPIEDNFII